MTNQELEQVLELIPGVHDKDKAVFLGVDPAQLSRWRSGKRRLSRRDELFFYVILELGKTKLKSIVKKLPLEQKKMF